MYLPDAMLVECIVFARNFSQARTSRCIEIDRLYASNGLDHCWLAVRLGVYGAIENAGAALSTHAKALDQQIR